MEDLRTNITLLRRKLRNPNLRIETMTLGSQTRTSVAIVYLEKIANPEVVEEVRARLARIKIDAILADQYIEELIRDAPSPHFPRWSIASVLTRLQRDCRRAGSRSLWTVLPSSSGPPPDFYNF